MLYRVILSNYKSFADEVQFDMFPNPKRENFIKHVYQGNVIPVLKQCAIYGANGAGKSNFVSSLYFLREWVTKANIHQDILWMKNWYFKNRFRLPDKDPAEPIAICIEFSTGQQVYIYNVEIDAEGVKTETLIKSGIGRGENQLIMERSRGQFSFKLSQLNDQVRGIISRQIEAYPAASLLGLNGINHYTDDAAMLAAYKWFKEGLSIITSNHQIPWLISVLKQQPTMMNFVKRVFSEIDLGIKDLYIHDESFEEWVEHADTNDKEVVNAILGNTPRSDGEYRQAMSKMGTEVPELDIYEENGKRMVRELIFRQLGQEDYVGEMDVSSQSSGTLRLLTLTPAIYEAIFSPCTVVFDEIDNGVHPMLIKKLIRYFGDSQTQGQLIYTTHETALLNQQELLRTDEIWLTEKAEGVTKMYSLNDFKIHKTLSIENGYMDGRFGGIPTIGKI